MNIIAELLKEDKIKYTHYFVNKLFKQHPYKNSMYGIVKMLEVYNIKSCGCNIKDKNIAQLSIPSIVNIIKQNDANTGKFDFAILSDIKDNIVKIKLNGSIKKYSISKFKDIWDGKAVVLLDDSDATEPNYTKNKKNDYIVNLRFFFLFLLQIMLLLYFFNYNTSFFARMSFILNLLCIHVFYLIIEKQLYEGNYISNKICSIVSRSNCVSIKNIKIPYIGEIPIFLFGISYYITRIVVLCINPINTCEIYVFDAIALSISVCCITYMVVTKYFCPLCLIIQSIIVSLFIMDMVSGVLSNKNIQFLNITVIGCIFLMVFILMKSFLNWKELEDTCNTLIAEYSQFKSEPKIFFAKLNEQKYYDVENTHNSILFGNKEAKTKITILSNPFCDSCAQKHDEIDHLLTVYGKDVSVQYIFMYFNKNLTIFNRLLIAAYYQDVRNVSKELFAKWFQYGRFNAKNFMSKYNYNLFDERIDISIREQEKWWTSNGLTTTPMVLVNGFVLPKEYSIGDLALVLNFNKE